MLTVRLSACLLLLVAANFTLAGPKAGAFAVGALRRDGVIVPFGVFDGKRWSARWPLPARDLNIPVSVRAIPSSWWGPTGALDEWAAWTGGPSRPVTVTQPDWIEAHCFRQIGLKTSYRSTRPAPAGTEQPYPKDGLAVSPPQPVEPIELLPGEAREVQAFRRELLDAFNKAERLVEGQYGHLIKQRSREGVEPLVEAVYAYGEEPRVYYVEAIRTYHRLGQPAGECSGVAFGSGWFVREHGQVRLLTEAVDLLPCNRYGATYMLPFGVMRLNGKTYWLAQFSGWDHERFVVVEMQKKNVEAVVNAWGGSC